MLNHIAGQCIVLFDSLENKRSVCYYYVGDNYE